VAFWPGAAVAVPTVKEDWGKRGRAGSGEIGRLQKSHEEVASFTSAGEERIAREDS